MRISILYSILFSVIATNMWAQTEPDTIPEQTELDEVIIISKATAKLTKQFKALSSLDDYLENSLKVTLIKRGNYGNEPMINNMTSERLNVTIDGMHIFGACTDKMDPVTSYVDISNLEEVNVSSGQSGAFAGATIGGSLNMVRSKHDFCHQGWSGGVDAGIESNGRLFSTGTKLKYSGNRFFADLNFMFRDAANYKAGGNRVIAFSQFRKYNASANLGVKLNEKNTLIGSFIFDEAQNVGYPALPMDVSLARALIGNVQHIVYNLGKFVAEWDTKIYYNNVRHVMDDTKRPAVPIHMDMPGWSSTYGVYSKLTSVSKNKHRVQLHLTAYNNRSKAEMTMYPNDQSQPLMFMYTWPDVQTIYSGITANDRIKFNSNHILNYSLTAGFHQNKVLSEFGLNSLKVFHPNVQATKNRFLYSGQVDYKFLKNGFELTLGAGYGERASSISEAYGFYLFNSFDRFDYIGNPHLKNEKSIESNVGLSYRYKRFKVGVSANYFHILDYIIGIPQANYYPMTIGASGIKEYQALKFANLLSSDLILDYRPINSLKTQAVFTYNAGQGFDGKNLPLMRPFSYRFSVSYFIKQADFELSTNGSAKQYAYSPDYGETGKSAFATLNFSAGYLFEFKDQTLQLRCGVENITDVYYATYSDWNNIPRKGRNIYFSVSYRFNKVKSTE